MQQHGIFLPGVYSELLPLPANDPMHESVGAVCRRTAFWTEPIDEWPDDVASLRALVAELTRCFDTENKILRGALQFYADRSHIKVGDFGIAVEDGKRAQDALTKIAR